VSVCLPGGRGCVGKERLGKNLMNRQVAMINQKGTRYNPTQNHQNPLMYGFLQLIGVINYMDGKSSNVSIPVENSGIIGLRAGASRMASIKPFNNNVGTSLMSMIKEIESMLFKLLGFEKVREPRIEMINGYFNLFTSKTNKERPKVLNFVRFLKLMQKNGLNVYYKSAPTPWLEAQGAPTVVKGVFKPKNKENKTYPTISLSPFGHVEILGANSFQSMVNAYKITTKTFRKSEVKNKLDVKFPELSQQKQKLKNKKNKLLNVSLLSSQLFSVKNKKLLYRSKPCESYPKPVIIQLAEMQGVASKGTKTVVCDRIMKTV
jgi:hypothetical protein